MELWRKPASAKWYYESAQCVDDVEISATAWTRLTYVSFDGTKDKGGGRRTDLRLEISEAEVEKLYQGLMKGRKEEIRRLERLERHVGKLTNSIRSKYFAAKFGSDEKKIFRDIWHKLRGL